MKTLEVELTEAETRAGAVNGRLAAIQLAGEHLILYGNVVDCAPGTDKPKRVRIQRGNPELHGVVVQPWQYTFLWWADEEED